MTNKEALRNLRFCKCEISKSEFVAHLKHGTVILAMRALEKQIPKRPHLEGDGYDDNGYMIYDTWICPCCEKHYEVDYDKYEHCPNCGQKIDWSDDDDEE